jgi:hypothetical protein
MLRLAPGESGGVRQQPTIRVTSRAGRRYNSLILQRYYLWHAACLIPGMESKLIALLAAEGSREATLLVRRGDGQFALARIDARVASASRLAARYAVRPFAAKR